MQYQTESKAQNWRAVAKLDGGAEAMLFLGRSNTQIRQGYLEAFNDILDEDERDQVVAIELQRWHGAPDAGYWEVVGTLRKPAPKLVRIPA